MVIAMLVVATSETGSHLETSMAMAEGKARERSLKEITENLHSATTARDLSAVFLTLNLSSISPFDLAPQQNLQETLTLAFDT